MLHALIKSVLYACLLPQIGSCLLLVIVPGKKEDKNVPREWEMRQYARTVRKKKRGDGSNCLCLCLKAFVHHYEEADPTSTEDSRLFSALISYTL